MNSQFNCLLIWYDVLWQNHTKILCFIYWISIEINYEKVKHTNTSSRRCCHTSNCFFFTHLIFVYCLEGNFFVIFVDFLAFIFCVDDISFDDRSLYEGIQNCMIATLCVYVNYNLKKCLINYQIIKEISPYLYNVFTH